MDLILTSILNVRLNDAVAGRCTWIIYTLLTPVLTISYVAIISKVIRKPHVHQLGSVITAERKRLVTLFSAASTLTLFPWVITALSKIQPLVYYQCCILIG